MEEENGGGSTETEKLLNSIVEELQTNFVTIPFEAWRYICKKTMKDLKIRFPNLKDLTELDEKTYYTRYLFHVTQNYKEFFTCVLTGFPVPPFPADVELLLEAKARNPTRSKFPPSIIESIKTTSLSVNAKTGTAKTDLYDSKIKASKRLIDYEDTEISDDDDTSSIFSEANLITKGARNSVTTSRRKSSSSSPKRSSTQSDSFLMKDISLSNSSLSNNNINILNDDFLTPLLEKDCDPGEALSEKSDKNRCVNPFNPEPPPKRSRPPVPTFSETDQQNITTARVQRPPPLEPFYDRSSTPPPPSHPEQTSLTSEPLLPGVNPFHPHNNSSGSTNSHEGSHSARLNQEAIRIKEEQRLRNKPDFIEEIEWSTPKLLAPESRLPYHEKNSMNEITIAIGSPPPVVLEGSNELLRIDPRMDPRRAQKNSSSSIEVAARRRESMEKTEHNLGGEKSKRNESDWSPSEADIAPLAGVDDPNTVTIIDDDESSVEEEEDDEEDDLEKGIPVTSETFEESFERRGTSDHSSSSSVVSDRSSYTNNSYITIRRRSVENSINPNSTTATITSGSIISSINNNTNLIPHLFKSTIPVISPTLNVKSPEAFIPFNNLNNDSNIINNNNSSSSGTWINGANIPQTFQKPLLPSPNIPSPQQQLLNQNRTNLSTQSPEMNPGQAFAAAASALTTAALNNNNSPNSLAFNGNGFNQMNTFPISVPSDFVPNANNLHYVMNNNQNNMSSFHDPRNSPNPFIPNPFDQPVSTFIPTNVISSFNNNNINTFIPPNMCMNTNTSNNNNININSNNGFGMNRNNKFHSRFSPQSRGTRRSGTSNSANLTSIPHQSPKNK